MEFATYGPFEVPRNGTRVDRTAPALRDFWDAVEDQQEGLTAACGCYVFSIRDRAWYVGMAEKQSFKRECFTAHKLVQFNESLSQVQGRPQLFFIAKHTPAGRFSKPSSRGHRDIRALESLLIGLALSRNPELQNVSGTKLFREMHVPGILNTRRGEARAVPVQKLKKALGV